MRELIEVLCGHEIDFYQKGRYASVFNNRHTGTVLKIGDADNNAGYLAYLKLARVHQDNPFFPKVHWASIFNDGKERYFVVKLERLHEGNDFIVERKLHPPMWWMIHQFIQRCIIKEDYFQDKFMGIPVPKMLLDFLAIIKSAFRKNDFKWDIHEDNMMMRGDGQLVITDPWA